MLVKKEIWRCASEHDERFVVDRRGKPIVTIMSVRDYIRSIAPTPAAYRDIRQEARKNGGSSMRMSEINREIAAHRRQSAKKRNSHPARSGCTQV